jgi:hypothetical protein
LSLTFFTLRASIAKLSICDFVFCVCNGILGKDGQILNDFARNFGDEAQEKTIFTVFYWILIEIFVV